MYKNLADCKNKINCLISLSMEQADSHRNLPIETTK